MNFDKKSPSAWYCIKCFEDIVPFGTPMRNSLKQTKAPKLSLLSLQKTTLHLLARILSIKSMNPSSGTALIKH